MNDLDKVKRNSKYDGVRMVKERKERLEGPVGVNQGRSVGWREGERKAGNSG